MPKDGAVNEYTKAVNPSKYLPLPPSALEIICNVQPNIIAINMTTKNVVTDKLRTISGVTLAIEFLNTANAKPTVIMKEFVANIEVV